jgi:voltage-gated potassium channel
MTEMTTLWRTQVYSLLEGHREAGDYSRLIRNLIVALIIMNGFAVVLESNQALYARYREWFNAFELFSVAIFTLEYLARVWVSTEKAEFTGKSRLQARLAYMASPMALVDLLAIAPFYLSLFIPIDLRYLRFFRLMRLLKLSHYFDGLQVFSTVLRREAGAIAGALLCMMILIIISACLMFTVENAAMPGHFESIAQAIWWAVVTLTTVGYGDVTPVTFGGKMLGIAIMLLGVGTMALPAGILAARFSEELQSRREMIKQRVIDAFRDGVMDANERSIIDELQQELGLSEDVVERMINEHKRSVAHVNYCPHCGESLN